jgi:DNA-directed RNA polymerase subunit E'/Rpb7
MEHTALFEERASLTSRDLRGEITDIDGLLLQKLSTRMENKCSRHGFVLPGTMKILSRSMGYIEKGRFTGDIIFHVQAEAKVLNPPAGFTLEGVVIRKNKMGMYVSYNDAIRIILPRDLHIGDEAFEAIPVGANVNVEIQKSRFQVNDAYILSVGLFRGLATAEAAPAEAVPEEVTPEEVAPEEVAPEEANAAAPNAAAPNAASANAASANAASPNAASANAASANAASPNAASANAASANAASANAASANASEVSDAEGGLENAESNAAQ